MNTESFFSENLKYLDNETLRFIEKIKNHLDCLKIDEEIIENRHSKQ